MPQKRVLGAFNRTTYTDPTSAMYSNSTEFDISPKLTATPIFCT